MFFTLIAALNGWIDVDLSIFSIIKSTAAESDAKYPVPIFVLLELIQRYVRNEYVEIILKGLGIVILTQICSDICKDSGEGTLAGNIETVGKLELLLLCIPLIEEILGTAERLLEMGG